VIRTTRTGESPPRRAASPAPRHPSPSPIPRSSSVRDVTWRSAKSRRSMKRSTGGWSGSPSGRSAVYAGSMCACARAYTHTRARRMHLGRASGGNLDGRFRARFFFESCHRYDSVGSKLARGVSLANDPSFAARWRGNFISFTPVVIMFPCPRARARIYEILRYTCRKIRSRRPCDLRARGHKSNEVVFYLRGRQDAPATGRFRSAFRFKRQQ